MASVSVATARNWLRGRTLPEDARRSLLAIHYDIGVNEWETQAPVPAIPEELLEEDARYRAEAREATTELAQHIKPTPAVDPHAAPQGVAPWLERMQFYTNVMRGEFQTAEVRDQIKAAELLSKASGDFVKRVELVSPPATRQEALARIEMLRRRVAQRQRQPAPKVIDVTKADDE